MLRKSVYHLQIYYQYLKAHIQIHTIRAECWVNGIISVLIRFVVYIGQIFYNLFRSTNNHSHHDQGVGKGQDFGRLWKRFFFIYNNEDIKNYQFSEKFIYSNIKYMFDQNIESDSFYMLYSFVQRERQTLKKLWTLSLFQFLTQLCKF